MIKHIIFDLGQVLVKVDINPFIYEFSKVFKIEPKELKKTENDGVYLDFQVGKINGEDFHRLICEHYNHFISMNQLKAIWGSMLVGEVEGTAVILKMLYKKRYALSLLSNTDPWHFEYCEKIVPDLDKFRHKFLSYDLKMKKPDAEIFLNVAEKLEAKPEQCLFIDDLEQNVASAKGLNFQTILFQNADQLRRELLDLSVEL